MPDKIYAYDNFNIDMNSDSFPILVWSVAAGVLAAIVIALVIRSFTGELVYRLKYAQSVDEGSAKTLDDLGFTGFLKLVAPFFLKDSSSILRYVQIANREEASFSKEPNGKKWKKSVKVMGRSFSLKKARFYLPEVHRITAETRFSREEHPIRSFVISTALLIAGAVFFSFALPELLLMLDNFISMNS